MGLSIGDSGQANQCEWKACPNQQHQEYLMSPTKHHYTKYDIIPAGGLFRQLNRKGGISGRIAGLGCVIGGIIYSVFRRPKCDRWAVSERRDPVWSQSLANA